MCIDEEYKLCTAKREIKCWKVFRVNPNTLEEYSPFAGASPREMIEKFPGLNPKFGTVNAPENIGYHCLKYEVDAEQYIKSLNRIKAEDNDVFIMRKVVIKPGTPVVEGYIDTKSLGGGCPCYVVIGRLTFE